MMRSRSAALIAVAVLVTASALTSFAESYRGLFLWAAGHGLHDLWVILFPLQVDTFVLVGELALFVALADQWRSRSHVAAWSVTLGGLAVSVAGNVGHIAGHSLASRARRPSRRSPQRRPWRSGSGCSSGWWPGTGPPRASPCHRN